MNSAQLRRVTVESFAHYRSGLVELLLDAVRQGASVGFLASLAASEAAEYFDSVQTELGDGSRLLWVVVNGEQVLASVQLSLCQKPNGLNRAEVQKLLVRSDSQRHGLGTQLMAALETAARQMQRGLLYLDTESGSPAEVFYQSMAYQLAGRIPDYACSPDGTYRPTALYYKTLQGPRP
ncbi:GNAT family N-acetyltransferase [Pseudomonas typographi]|uniref:GNAT family N-acetyltransferase n=1 Tax=Pseudomonas typographi TaxID=2715964 RepID=A0ABR7Z9R3_9PSED|nr:GNAT family N-acetyltransferase [Pseudomonas typographi]MBD1555062.1 GNAT family N-acetyltransferase [Pseudomonas typographi]MBD1590099.1 GNAT family N-acetyltransferase [Pseudomonas typographi]MBD1602162.1 GNAT family N-acetyltransferase [Pseudomonas typographi]